MLLLLLLAIRLTLDRLLRDGIRTTGRVVGRRPLSLPPPLLLFPPFLLFLIGSSSSDGGGCDCVCDIIRPGRLRYLICGCSFTAGGGLASWSRNGRGSWWRRYRMTVVMILVRDRLSEQRGLFTQNAVRIKQRHERAQPRGGVGSGGVC